LITLLKERLDLKEAITSLIILAAIGFIAAFGKLILGGMLSGMLIMNNRIDVDSLLTAVLAILFVILLVMSFNPVRFLASFYLKDKIKNNQELFNRIIPGCLLFVYTFPIYYLIARRPGNGEESFSFFGSPLVMINWATDYRFTGLFDFVNWIALIWGVGIFVYCIIYTLPLIRIYSEGIADRAIEKTSKLPEQKSEDSTLNNVS